MLPLNEILIPELNRVAYEYAKSRVIASKITSGNNIVLQDLTSKLDLVRIPISDTTYDNTLQPIAQLFPKVDRFIFSNFSDSRRGYRRVIVGKISSGEIIRDDLHHPSSEHPITSIVTGCRSEKFYYNGNQKLDVMSGNSSKVLGLDEPLTVEGVSPNDTYIYTVLNRTQKTMIFRLDGDKASEMFSYGTTHHIPIMSNKYLVDANTAYKLDSGPLFKFNGNFLPYTFINDDEVLGVFQSRPRELVKVNISTYKTETVYRSDRELNTGEKVVTNVSNFGVSLLFLSSNFVITLINGVFNEMNVNRDIFDICVI